MPRWLTTSFAVALALAAGLARAEDHVPADVSSRQVDISGLPPAPPEFASRADGVVRWDAPRAAAPLVDRLVEARRTAWPRIERELGAELDDALVIRIATRPEQMAALAPRDAPPPAYAVGVAYPASGLILLTLRAPRSWEPPDLDRVLVHELSHVALHRAVGGRPLPRWFAEGLAIHQARERSLERVRTLWDGTVRGTLIPLDDLSRGFPARPHAVGIAYAQSADFVEWLYRRGEGPSRMADLLRRIGRGRDFEAAVSETWGAEIGQLEHEWRTGLSARFGALPLLFGTGLLWALIALLAVLAWLRRRRDAKATLRRWEQEEALERARTTAAQASALAAPRSEAARGPGPRATGLVTLPDAEDPDDAPGLDEPMPWNVGLGPRQEREGVPTIRWDGRDHTLH